MAAEQPAEQWSKTRIIIASAVVVVAGYFIWNTFGPGYIPAGAGADWSAINRDVRDGYDGVILRARYDADGDFYLVDVSYGTTEFGATRIACERVRPTLIEHGAGEVDFAVYDPGGNVLATGGRC